MLTYGCIDDPQPRLGFCPGDVVRISVDPYGLCGREPHPPVVPSSMTTPFTSSSPCRIGVVASYDAEASMLEWREQTDDDAHIDFYYVATNAGYYVFAHYELAPTEIGNLNNLPEPWCLPC